MIDLTRVAAAIRDVPDFPSPGIAFKDISPLLADPGLFADVVAAMAEPFADAGIDLVAGIEARGFIVGAPVAQRLGAGFVPVRKLGKLPAETVQASYTLEYGTDSLEMHRDAIAPGQRILIVDDLLATGGTAAATVGMVKQLGGVVEGVTFLIELVELKGRDRLAGEQVTALLQY
jgi:adenine phosphoribosyltransferase